MKVILIKYFSNFPINHLLNSFIWVCVQASSNLFVLYPLTLSWSFSIMTLSYLLKIFTNRLFSLWLNLTHHLKYNAATFQKKIKRIFLLNSLSMKIVVEEMGQLRLKNQKPIFLLTINKITLVMYCAKTNALLMNQTNKSNI